MRKKPTILQVLLRLTFVLGPATVLLGLFIAMVVWPESRWARTWNIAFVMLILGNFAAYVVTRSRRNRLKQEALDKSSPASQEMDNAV